MNMRKFVVSLVCSVLTMCASAQIPNYPGTVGDSLVDIYTSLKFRPGVNKLETYSNFEYGVGDHWAFGMDLYTGYGDTEWGATARYGNKISKWFGAGAQITPSFDLNNNFHFSYFTSALYLKESITKNERLFWSTNTWWTIYDGSDNTITNDEYLGYDIPFTEKSGLSILAGLRHDWQFDADPQPAGGLYYYLNAWTFYLWGDDFLGDHPRAVIGIEVIL